MCRQGNTVGGDFKEIAAIIEQVKDKSRVGVCLDTCHAYAAGYDIKSEAGFNKTMEEFDKVIGLKYLKGVHLNDSKGMASHRTNNSLITITRGVEFTSGSSREHRQGYARQGNVQATAERPEV